MIFTLAQKSISYLNKAAYDSRHEMPPQLEWSPAYNIGHPVLDQRRRQFLRICNEFAKCCGLQGAEMFSRYHELLDDLARFARESFLIEETILEKIRYPSLEGQKVEHLAFEEHLADVLFDASRGIIDVPKTNRFLSDWWNEHVLVSDMQYKELLGRPGLSS